MAVAETPLGRLAAYLLSSVTRIVQVLQPIQAAKLLVQAFPFPPDLLSVISTLVEEAGEPAAIELLASRAVAPSLSSFHQP